MLTESLPTTLDVRKAAARGAIVKGVLQPTDLKRFRPLLAGDKGDISVVMVFARNEEGRHLLHLAIEAEIVVTCERCLEAMPNQMCSESTLAMVRTDEEAAHLPKHLDALIVKESACNLWDVVEDELILALPPFSYHEAEVCSLKFAAFSEPSTGQCSEKEKPNPFNVLEQLKPGK